MGIPAMAPIGGKSQGRLKKSTKIYFLFCNRGKDVKFIFQGKEIRGKIYEVNIDDKKFFITAGDSKDSTWYKIAEVKNCSLLEKTN